MKRENKLYGNWGEDVVREFLEKNNYVFLEKNFLTKLGELDLVFKKMEYLVFVEVKTRKKHEDQIPVIIPFSKQQRIVKTAKLFMLQRGYSLSDHVVRFDVAYVFYSPGERPEIKHIENAFFGR